MAVDGWPPPGWLVTFATWDLSKGRARFIGIGVAAGPPQRGMGLPLRPVPGGGPVPEWVSRSDIMDAVPPPEWGAAE
ncbi:hypothetical protein [Actinokineospora pegani]|uniref:hypothetical protein n=1 Tax=Actinokineospora pegani TaxID=2654637 RepID=UPI0012EABEDA|nr:hypothetical protein [Actinokineospora pegani]